MHFKTVKILKTEDKGDGVHYLWYTENDKLINLEKHEGHWYVTTYQWKEKTLTAMSLTKYDFI